MLLQVYTTGGIELARVTVVSLDSKVCYEKPVRPAHQVIDYNTRFSGLTAEMMLGQSTTLKDVQKDLLTNVRGEDHSGRPKSRK